MQIVSVRRLIQDSCIPLVRLATVSSIPASSTKRWTFSIIESFGMPQPAVALSITNTMNPHLFFHHPYRSCSPATSSSTFSTWRRSRCHRTRAGDQVSRLERKNEEDMRRAARTAPGTSAQHAEEEVQPRRAGPDRPLGGKLPNEGNILRSPSVAYFSKFIIKKCIKNS